MISKEQILGWIEKKATPFVVKEHAGNRHEIYDKTFPFTSWPYFDGKDNQVRMDMHGGGPKHFYGLQNNQLGSEGALELPMFGVVPYGHEGFPQTIHKLRENKDIDKVFSAACNIEGGGRPEFFEKLLDKDLKEVIMTPPGYYGVAGQQMTNAVSNTLNTVLDIMGEPGGRGSAQHIYHKQEHWMPFGIGDHWKDVGVHETAFDHAAMNYGLPAAGLGMAGLAYALFKKKQNKEKLTKIKNQVVKKK